jgi:hypothetical protein
MGLNPWPARLCYADRCQKYKLSIFNKVSAVIEAVRYITYVILPRAARETAHYNGCGPQPQKGWRRVTQRHVTN